MLSEVLPNLIILGAMKAGTSALHAKLELHPQICMSDPKELNFFLSADDLSATRAAEMRRSLQWQRGLSWYGEHFDPSAVIRGEASPNYTSPEHYGVATRMADVLPNAKLIFITRDPVSRSISQYRHRVLEGTERRPVDVALRDRTSGYLVRSQYHLCLQPFLDAFELSQFCLIAHEDLWRDPRATLRDVYGFLGVDRDYWEEAQADNTYETSGRGRQPAFVRRARSLRVTQRLEERLPKSVVARARKIAERPSAVGENLSTPSPDTLAFLREFFASDQEAVRTLVADVASANKV
jgi:hypothetical protein